MLSRSAQGLYWMGRYLERAQRLSILLRLQTAALVDRPAREIYFGWSRIYGTMNRNPPLGSLDMFDEDDYTLADSYTLADDLTFERSNPASVWSCFALGRENARQMRHCISAEMWTRLNLAYLRIQSLGIQDIWSVAPENFYAQTAAEIDTFTGVAGSTMYRDEGWSFMQLGRFVERAQLSVSLLLTQLALDTSTKEDSDADWTSLLHACHAVDAYSRIHSVEVHPSRALDLLVADSALPDSVCRAVDMASAELAGIESGPGARSSAAARRLVGRMGALIHYDWPDREDREDVLRQVQEYCWDLHSLITTAYFDYPIGDVPLR